MIAKVSSSSMYAVLSLLMLGVLRGVSAQPRPLAYATAGDNATYSSSNGSVSDFVPTTFEKRIERGFGQLRKHGIDPSGWQVIDIEGYHINEGPSLPFTRSYDLTDITVRLTNSTHIVNMKTEHGAPDVWPDNYFRLEVRRYEYITLPWFLADKRLTADEAIEKLKGRGFQQPWQGVEIYSWGKDLDPWDAKGRDSELRLWYRFSDFSRGSAGGLIYFVDAQSGEVVTKRPGMKEQLEEVQRV